MAPSTKQPLSLPLLLLVSLTIFAKFACSSPKSFTDAKEASGSHSCSDSVNQQVEELKSKVFSLESIIKEKTKELLRKEEKIQSLEKSSKFDSQVKHSNLPKDKAYELHKQISELQQELVIQRQRRLEVETRAEISDKKVAELSSKLENIDRNWFSSKNLHETQAYLITLWHEHLSPNLHTTLQKVFLKLNQVQKWSKPHIESMNSRLIPSIKELFSTLTMSLKPRAEYLTNKSFEVFCIFKESLTPYFIKGIDSSFYYLKEVRTYTDPYTSHIMNIAKPHLDKVHVVLEPYAENIRDSLSKLMNSTKIYHQQAQEMLKNNEVTKPVATMDLAWVAATALLGFPLVFIIKLLSAVSNPKKKRKYNHKQESTAGYRRPKRRLHQH